MLDTTQVHAAPANEDCLALEVYADGSMNVNVFCTESEAQEYVRRINKTVSTEEGE